MLLRDGVITTAAKDEDSVYRMYYDYQEPVLRMAPHRVLAVNRGEREGFLKVTLSVPSERILDRIRRRLVRGNGEAVLYCECSFSIF